MRIIVQYNSPWCAKLIQIFIQSSQGAFRIIPAPTFIDGHVDILNPNPFHKVQKSWIPVTAKYCFVIPVRARDEDLLDC